MKEFREEKNNKYYGAPVSFKIIANSFGDGPETFMKVATATKHQKVVKKRGTSVSSSVSLENLSKKLIGVNNNKIR